MLTKGSKYFTYPRGLKIAFDTIPNQEDNSKNVCMNSAQESPMDMETSEMLKKEAMSLVRVQEKGFLIDLY